MARRGYSTKIGKFSKLDQDRRRSQIRIFGELLRLEQDTARTSGHSLAKEAASQYRD